MVGPFLYKHWNTFVKHCFIQNSFPGKLHQAEFFCFSCCLLLAIYSAYWISLIGANIISCFLIAIILSENMMLIFYLPSLDRRRVSNQTKDLTENGVVGQSRAGGLMINVLQPKKLRLYGVW